MLDTGTEPAARGVTVRQTDPPHRTVRTLHETMRGVDTPGQTYALIRTYAIGRNRVRVTVHIDEHRAQSHLVAEAWDGKGWGEVAGILGQDPLVAEGAASGHLPRERSDEKRQSLERFADELLRRCLQVIAEAPSDDDTTGDLTRAVQAVERTAAGDSNDEEVEALQTALQIALTRWPGITYAR